MVPILALLLIFVRNRQYESNGMDSRLIWLLIFPLSVETTVPYFIGLTEWNMRLRIIQAMEPL